MANVAFVGNNCYADLHIYAETVENEHVYSSLQRKKLPTKPVSFTWKAIHQVSIFKRSKFALIAGVCVLLVLASCSVGIGYFIGKNSCKKQAKEHFKPREESGQQKTTQSTSSSFSDIIVTENNTINIHTTAVTTRIKNHTSTRDRIETTTDDRPRIKANLDGHVFKLYRKTDDKFWHYDESVRKFVSALWQPDDIFTKFKFIKMADGSYKIMSIYSKVFLFDGYGVEGAKSTYLNGRENPDDNHMRFLITMETKTLCRIRTKATGRYLRMDENLLVSSIKNIKDNNSLFRLKRVR